MNIPSNETLIVSTGHHKGIFVPPAIVFLFTLIPAGLMTTVLQMVWRVARQQGSNPLAFIPLILFLPAFIFLIGSAIAYWKGEVGFTENRLVFQKGLIFKVNAEIPYSQVETMRVVEPLIGRWLGYGHVVVVGTGGSEYQLQHIPNPTKFHAKLRDAVEAYRTRS